MFFLDSSQLKLFFGQANKSIAKPAESSDSSATKSTATEVQKTSDKNSAVIANDKSDCTALKESPGKSSDKENKTDHKYVCLLILTSVNFIVAFRMYSRCYIIFLELLVEKLV